jgi:hypothetical protein
MPPENLRASIELLRASVTGRPIGVDRKANVLRGYVVAQLGPFKTPGRGEFDEEALREIVRLGNELKQGLKSRFNHAGMCDDGLGKHLGRARDLFMSEAKNADGATVPAVRADLHFDETALAEPPGGGKPLGLYVMDLAESDPDAISSSLVIRVNREYRLNPDGTRKKDEKGEDLPPLWRPLKLRGSDIVDTGDAVDGLLAADVIDSKPFENLWNVSDFMDDVLDGMGRDEAEERVLSFVNKYLLLRFGPKLAATATEKRFLEAVNTAIQKSAKDWSQTEERKFLTGEGAEQPLGLFATDSAQPSLADLLVKQKQRERELLV